MNNFKEDQLLRQGRAHRDRGQGFHKVSIVQRALKHTAKVPSEAAFQQLVSKTRVRQYALYTCEFTWLQNTLNPSRLAYRVCTAYYARL